MLVCGTGTEVGKTWVGSRLLRELRGRGLSVAARKPAQSFDIDSEGTTGSGEPPTPRCSGRPRARTPTVVAPPFRSYHRAMAPPMAAEALGLPGFTVGELVEEMDWPPDAGAGGRGGDGRRGPVPAGIGRRRLRPARRAGSRCGGAGVRRRPRHHQRRADVDGCAGRGTARAPIPVVVVLDRFDGHHEIHRRNREWLAERYGYRVVTLPGEEAALADAVVGRASGPAGQTGETGGSALGCEPYSAG